MALVTVTLADGLGNQAQIVLSAEDANRCETDLDFAQRLFDAALAAASEPAVPSTSNFVQPGPSSSNFVQLGPSSSSSSTNSSSTVEESPKEDESPPFKWSHAAILLLVEAFRAHEKDLTSGRSSLKRVWENISAVMAKKGYVVSGQQCMTKFNGMKRIFKAISDHNSKSGNSPRTWAYFELMQTLLGERPFMEPLALSSSTSGRVRSAGESSFERSTEVPEPSPRSSRKRSATEDLSAIANAILESRRIGEGNKNKRHAEKMMKKNAILSKLDALLDKL